MNVEGPRSIPFIRALSMTGRTDKRARTTNISFMCTHAHART
jgi:hypothetical protein